MKKLIITILFLIITTNLFSNPINHFELIPERFKSESVKIQLRYDIPDWLLYSVPMKESSWRVTALSRANCIGLMQLNPRYTDYFIEMYWELPEKFDIYNPYHNLRMGFAYLSALKFRFGSWEMALAAYNAGPTRVARYDVPEETIDYIVDIKNMMYRL